MPQHTSWRKSEFHRRWLMHRADNLFEFYQPNIVNPQGGFYELDDHAKPLPSTTRALVWTTRFIHCFSLGRHLGRPGSAEIIDHGMQYLWNVHRDSKNGGYSNSNGDNGPVDATKQAYGHAFVLLAAASAKTAGHPDADRLLADITEILLTRFWEKNPGLTSEEYAADWSKISNYRGQNSNMHLTEALMAAFEATRDNTYLAMANSIAQNLIQRITAQNQWRLPEHFDANWQIDTQTDQGDPVFRPAGSTPGHWLEWSRLLLQLWELGQREHAWLPVASKKLFAQSITEGWDSAKGGFYYTVDFTGQPLWRDRLWWPTCEGIGAATYLANLDADPLYEAWYEKLWGWTNAHLLNRKTSGWYIQLDDNLTPIQHIFIGQPDMYHALQAALIPLFATNASLTSTIGAGKPD